MIDDEIHKEKISKTLLYSIILSFIYLDNQSNLYTNMIVWMYKYDEKCVFFK